MITLWGKNSKGMNCKDCKWWRQRKEAGEVKVGYCHFREVKSLATSSCEEGEKKTIKSL